MNLSGLLNTAGQGNRIAQKQVYEHFARRMYLLCRQYTRDDMIAEDIVIHGFLRFFRRLASFQYEGEGATHQFLKKIMVNQCLRYLKKNRTIYVLGVEALPDTRLPEEVMSLLSAKEIYALIAKLPLGYRAVFNFVVLEDMTHKEVAAALNISEKTSQYRFRRARHLLRQMLIQNNNDYENRKTKLNKREAE